jgi:hypothetical protein
MPHQVSQHEADRSEEYRNHNIDSELDCVQGPALNRMGGLMTINCLTFEPDFAGKPAAQGAFVCWALNDAFNRRRAYLRFLRREIISLIPYPAPNAIITAISQTTSCIAKLCQPDLDQATDCFGAACIVACRL